MDAPVSTLVHISPDEAPAVWPQIVSYVHEANEYGGGKFATHDWLARVLIGAADLFVSPNVDSAAICEAQMFPRRAVYTIVLLGGEGGHDWDRYQEVFEQAAKARNCSCLEVFGRGGWRTILKKQGYELAHYVWRKEL